ncbi:hypothetical protein SISSUDRAFT_1011393 [Sistotremastrum suecicum HHB10207 ss-3]|uniref:Alpha/beta-hydrolase n=1 Tax=Sistotremastrum suecicum HHB10207 ss-3 TaxID=1314776 RepID=A0A165Y7G6_9AGAM|nr:hypothetical protein SISSUDRAFT_1011393 [Sistotremastrum suecicum HHB10207 ss-3]
MSSLKSTLPSFLSPHPTKHSEEEGNYLRGVLNHTKSFPGTAEALWWPCLDSEALNTILVLVPGNPGIVDFYIPFLSALQTECARFNRGLAILCHSHLGHAPSLPLPSETSLGLRAQVETRLEVYDHLRQAYGSKIKLVFVGHSIGAWIALQVLKERKDVDDVFLLFPTISNIARTPNGRRLSWMFNRPIPSIVSSLGPMAQVLPFSVYAWLFPTWPHAQHLVLKSLATSRSASYAALYMAHEEMETVKTLDTDLLLKYKKRLWFFFAERDDWVGEERERIIRSLEHDQESIQVVHGTGDIPHAFCISHSNELAVQCASWLSARHVI